MPSLAWVLMGIAPEERLKSLKPDTEQTPPTRLMANHKTALMKTAEGNKE